MRASAFASSEPISTLRRLAWMSPSLARVVLRRGRFSSELSTTPSPLRYNSSSRNAARTSANRPMAQRRWRGQPDDGPGLPDGPVSLLRLVQGRPAGQVDVESGQTSVQSGSSHRRIDHRMYLPCRGGDYRGHTILVDFSPGKKKICHAITAVPPEISDLCLAAVNEELDAVDIAGLVARQKQGSGDLIDFGDAAQRHTLRHERQDLLLATGEALQQARRLGRPRADGVDAHAAAGQIQCPAAGPVAHRSLAGGVNALARSGDPGAGGRGDQDDRRLVAQQRQRLLHREDHTLTLVPRVWSTCSSVISPSGASAPLPELATTMSRLPARSRTVL